MFYTLNKYLGNNRFTDKIHSANLKTFRFFFRICISCQEDYRHIRSHLGIPHLTEGAKTIHILHFEVQQNQCRLVVVQIGNQLFSGMKAGNQESIQGQNI